MPQAKKFIPHATTVAIRSNRDSQAGLPPAFRDLAELLAEIAVRRLQGIGTTPHRRQEPLGDQ
jgi:hypothetical protein